MRIAEAGVAHALDARVLGEPPGQLERARRLALDAERERAQAAEEEPGRVGRGDEPGACAKLAAPALAAAMRRANRKDLERLKRIVETAASSA